MNDKDNNILEGAIELFTRYGFKKTTMGDIASQAQISRQTLYSKYENKSDVMKACLLMVADKMCSNVEAEWAEQPGLKGKLEVFLRINIVEPFVALRSLPDAEDLMAIYDGMSQQERNAMDERKIRLLASAFEPYISELTARETNPANMAEYMLRSAEGFKPIAQDQQHLQSMLDILLTSALLMIDNRLNS